MSLLSSSTRRWENTHKSGGPGKYTRQGKSSNSVYCNVTCFTEAVTIWITAFKFVAAIGAKLLGAENAWICESILIQWGRQY